MEAVHGLQDPEWKGEKAVTEVRLLDAILPEAARHDAASCPLLQV